MLKQRVFKSILSFITGDEQTNVANVAQVGTFEPYSGVTLAISRLQEDLTSVTWVKVENIFVSNSLMKPNQQPPQPIDVRTLDEAVNVVVPNADGSGVSQTLCTFEEYMFGAMPPVQCSIIPQKFLKYYAHKFIQMQTLLVLNSALYRGDPPPVVPPYTLEKMLTDSKVPADNQDALIQSGTICIPSVLKYLVASVPESVYSAMATAIPHLVHALQQAAGSGAGDVQNAIYTSFVRACMFATGALQATPLPPERTDADVRDFDNGVWASSVTGAVFVRNGEQFIDCPIYWFERMFALPLGLIFPGSGAPVPNSDYTTEEDALAQNGIIAILEGEQQQQQEQQQQHHHRLRAFASNYIIYNVLPNCITDLSLHNMLTMLRVLNEGAQLYANAKTEPLGNLWLPDRAPFTDVSERYAEADSKPSPFVVAPMSEAMKEAEVKKKVFAATVPASDCFERRFGSRENRRVYSVSKPNVNIWYDSVNFTHAYVVHA